MGKLDGKEHIHISVIARRIPLEDAQVGGGRINLQGTIQAVQLVHLDNLQRDVAGAEYGGPIRGRVA